ncbi:hypothetical protein [Phyllobacterium sp. SB3]|uniref:hypothetical protein n=1 Tax=Phyllobacterium sp. SB3 TaxID=3156073 RepID=UPI0032AFAD9C
MPVELMSNMFGWAHSIKTENVVRGPSGDMAKTMIHESDVASAAAQILMHGGHREEVCRLSGPEALTARQKLRKLNRVLGRNIRYLEVGEQHTREMMQRLGMRSDVIEYVIEWDKNPPSEAREPNHVFENIVRRKPSTLMDWLDENSHAFEASNITLDDIQLAASA